MDTNGDNRAVYSPPSSATEVAGGEMMKPTARLFAFPALAVLAVAAVLLIQPNGLFGEERT